MIGPGVMEEYLQSLALNRERFLTFSTWFYDASLVFVYCLPSSSPLENTSNLLHELAHAELANTPLGFLRQTLFELSARLADSLYQTRVLPVLREHAVKHFSSDERQPDAGLISGAPRTFAEQERTRKVADQLYQHAHDDIVNSLFADVSREQIELFLLLQRRHKAIAEHSILSHEAAATYWQLGDRPGLESAYASAFGLLGKVFPASGELGGLREFVRAKSQSLSGVWKEAFELAREIESRVGNEKAVMLAAKLALHFDYRDCKLLDMPEAEFHGLTESIHLSADLRMKALADMPIALKAACESEGAEVSLLQATLRRPDGSSNSGANGSFSDWINQFVIGSNACRKAGINFVAHKVPNDDWCTQPLRATPRLAPLVLPDGCIFAQSPKEAHDLRRDFVRSHRVRILDRVCNRMMQ